MSFGQPIPGQHYCSLCGYTIRPCKHAKSAAANEALATRNNQLETALRELVEAAEFGDELQMMLAGNPNVIERATTRYHDALTAANNLLATPKGEDDAE